MPLEIERKFLVTDASWREQCTKSERLRDGLVAVSDGLKVRVRLYEDRATLAIETKRVGGVRDEYEYEIPRQRGSTLLFFISEQDPALVGCGTYFIAALLMSALEQDMRPSARMPSTSGPPSRCRTVAFASRVERFADGPRVCGCIGHRQGC